MAKPRASKTGQQAARAPRRKTRRRGPVVLRQPEQVRAASSLVAHELIALMERLRRATVAEMAEHLGREPSSLYYHVRKLAGAGVLAAGERRPTGGRQEVVYELTGTEVVLDPDERADGFVSELVRSVRTRLRAVERAFAAALGRPGARRRGRGRNLSLHQHHARLRPKDLDELQRRIAALEEFLVEADDPDVDRFVSVTVAVVPADRGGR